VGGPGPRTWSTVTSAKGLARVALGLERWRKRGKKKGMM